VRINKKDLSHILLYRDEFDEDTWDNYCEISGGNSWDNVLKLVIVPQLTESRDETDG
jgi:hypothetical protein